MSRPCRIEYPGATYHVMSRGVARTATFLDSADYRMFLTMLAWIVRKGVLVVHAYCLMPNHFHILVETPAGKLSRWMQLLLGYYALEFNRRHQRIGHLWQGRYKSLLVDDGQYFLNCSRYIHLNPIHAELVRKPEDYLWSSYRSYTSPLADAGWIHIARTLRDFVKPADYTSFVEGNSEPINPFEKATAGLVWGSEEYVATVKALLADSQGTSAQNTLTMLDRADQAVPVMDVNRLKSRIDRIFHDWPSRGRRRVLMYSLRSLTQHTVEDIARIADRSPSAVSKAVRAVNERARRDAELSGRLRELLPSASHGDAHRI